MVFCVCASNVGRGTGFPLASPLSPHRPGPAAGGTARAVFARVGNVKKKIALRFLCPAARAALLWH